MVRVRRGDCCRCRPALPPRFARPAADARSQTAAALLLWLLLLGWLLPTLLLVKLEQGGGAAAAPRAPAGACGLRRGLAAAEQAVLARLRALKSTAPRDEPPAGAADAENAPPPLLLLSLRWALLLFALAQATALVAPLYT